MGTIVKLVKIVAIIMAIPGMIVYAAFGEHVVSGAIVGSTLGGAFGGACGLVLGILALITPPFLKLLKWLLKAAFFITLGIVIAMIILWAFSVEFG
jgi:hypothetical protein